MPSRLFSFLSGLNPFARILQQLLHLPEELAQTTDDEDFSRLPFGWYVFSTVAGIGVGFWVARLTLHSVPPGDYSMGGFIFILAAFFMFLIGFGIASSLLAMAFTFLPGLGRSLLAMGLCGFLFFMLYLPMRNAAREEAIERDAMSQEARKHDAEVLTRQMEQLPLVAPVFVPDMLEIAIDGHSYQVRNTSGKMLSVGIALVLLRDKLMDRCWAEAPVPDCVEQSAACTLAAASGIPGMPTLPMTASQPYAILLPNQAATFQFSHCDARFGEGMPEYRVWNNDESRFHFQSETSLIADHP